MRKLIFLFVPLLFLSVEGFSKPRRLPKPKTKIIKASVYLNNATVTSRLSSGFSDSSFNYSNFTPASTAFCYIGRIESVCRKIKKEANRMAKAYTAGNHDNIELKSCEINAKAEGNPSQVVRVRYNLFDDYRGNFDVERTIAKCQ